MTPEQVIECTIGLFDKPVKRGKYPPVLAADIMAALVDAGYVVVPYKRGLAFPSTALQLGLPDAPGSYQPRAEDAE